MQGMLQLLPRDKKAGVVIYKFLPLIGWDTLPGQYFSPSLYVWVLLWSNKALSYLQYEPQLALQFYLQYEAIGMYGNSVCQGGFGNIFSSLGLKALY